MNPIELNILFHNEETATAENLQLEIDITAFDPKPVYFYRIDNMQALTIKNIELTTISSGGEDFMCVTPYEKLKRIIAVNNKKTI